MQDQKKYWLGFSLVKGIGAVRVRGLLDAFGDLEAAWHASRHRLMQAGLSDRLALAVVLARKETDLEAVIADLDRRQIRALTWQDPDYPRHLLDIDQPPPVIYLRGKLAPQDMWAAAIVGTRRVTAYGRQVAAEMAGFLAQNGVTVVSGLARGIDTIAHRAALEAGGRTLAVLGCGVDQVYPPENTRLVHEMLETGRGALLSDYPAGTLPEGPNFPPRNRIISGLALAVIVVEAGERSGALITANFALEQGREVFAVPGNITGPQSVGTNRLIKNGAHPYLQPLDVLDVLDWVRVVQYPSETRPVPENGMEQQLYQYLRQEARHIDMLSILLDEPVDRIAAMLTVMELKGLVKNIGGMTYTAV